MSNSPASPPAQDLSSAILGRTFPAHACFPQLKTASDSALMLDLFRKHLKPVSALNFHFEECLPVRFRWRSDGSHCVLQYELQLGANGNWHPPNLWVTAFIYPRSDEAEAAWEKQAAACNPRPSSNTPWLFEPLAFIPEFNMLAHIFPYDRLLPNLPEIVSGPWLELQQRLLRCFGPGQWQMEQQTVEPLRYLAEDSAVIRYALRASNTADARSETRRFYAKAYRTRYGEQIGQILQQVHQKTAGSETAFTVVEPLFYCPQRRCLVLAEAPGRSLQDLLMAGGERDTIAAARRVARALAAFNKMDLTLTVSHSAEEQIGFLKRAAELLCWACPDSSSIIEAAVKSVSSGLRDVAHVPIHWDLKTDHIFWDGDRVLFIDLDTISLGDPARDPAHLAAHIAGRIDVPEMGAELAHATAGALVQEYFSQVPASWHQQFDLQFLIALVEGACGLFKRQEPRWAERAATVLQDVERVLTGELRLS